MEEKIEELVLALKYATPQIEKSVSLSKYVNDLETSYSLKATLDIVYIEDIFSNLSELIEIIEPDWLHEQDKITDILDIISYMSTNVKFVSKVIDEEISRQIQNNLLQRIDTIIVCTQGLMQKD